MTNATTPSSITLAPSLEMAWANVDSSFERFCLTAGIGAIEHMLREDAQQLAGVPHSRREDRVGQRWAEPRARSDFMGARLRCIARGCAASTALNLRCRPGRRRTEDWLGR